ncbi:MAG: preprotein translocase subunit YajC [Lachnospiraceae bacterium]|nr:preprotein translocase subunit YajC [Lachnospiraceae bacterium]
MVSVFATAQAGGGTSGMLSMVIMLVAMFAIFYFMLIRPQNKQRKEHEALLASLEVGDSILTTSGFYGVVIQMEDEVVVVEFGNNKNCRIPMKKENILEVDKGNEE